MKKEKEKEDEETKILYETNSETEAALNYKQTDDIANAETDIANPETIYKTIITNYLLRSVRRGDYRCVCEILSTMSEKCDVSEKILKEAIDISINLRNRKIVNELLKFASQLLKRNASLQNMDVWPAYQETFEWEPIFVIMSDEKYPEDQYLGHRILWRNCNLVSHEACIIANSDVVRDNPLSYREMESMNKLIRTADLFKNHKKITVTNACSCKSRNNGLCISLERCIVIYTLAKGLIPFDEQPFPKSVFGVPVDVREGYVTLGGKRPAPYDVRRACHNVKDTGHMPIKAFSRCNGGVTSHNIDAPSNNILLDGSSLGIITEEYEDKIFIGKSERQKPSDLLTCSINKKKLNEVAKTYSEILATSLIELKELQIHVTNNPELGTQRNETWKQSYGLTYTPPLIANESKDDIQIHNEFCKSDINCMTAKEKVPDLINNISNYSLPDIASQTVVGSACRSRSATKTSSRRNDGQVDINPHLKIMHEDSIDQTSNTTDANKRKPMLAAKSEWRKPSSMLRTLHDKKLMRSNKPFLDQTSTQRLSLRHHVKSKNRLYQLNKSCKKNVTKRKRTELSTAASRSPFHHLQNQYFSSRTATQTSYKENIADEYSIQHISTDIKQVRRQTYLHKLYYKNLSQLLTTEALDMM